MRQQLAEHVPDMDLYLLRLASQVPPLHCEMRPTTERTGQRGDLLKKKNNQEVKVSGTANTYNKTEPKPKRLELKYFI